MHRGRPGRTYARPRPVAVCMTPLGRTSNVQLSRAEKDQRYYIKKTSPQGVVHAWVGQRVFNCGVVKRRDSFVALRRSLGDAAPLKLRFRTRATGTADLSFAVAVSRHPRSGLGCAAAAARHRCRFARRSVTARSRPYTTRWFGWGPPRDPLGAARSATELPRGVPSQIRSRARAPPPETRGAARCCQARG